MNQEQIKKYMSDVGISVEYLTNTKQIELLKTFAEKVAEHAYQDGFDAGWMQGYDNAMLKVKPK